MSKKQVVFLTVLMLAASVAAEAFALIAGRYILPRSLAFCPECIPFDREELIDIYEKYLEDRHPVLGWPTRSVLDEDSDHDETTSRLNPLFSNPDEHQNCVSLYGDSYTWSSEVTPEYAWSVRLSELLNCRVGNFGIRGYGSDQAYLRYLENKHDTAQIVLLNHLSENIIRNVGQYRALASGYSSRALLSLKPRFILEQEGSLGLIDIPTVKSSDFPDLLEHPAKYLPHEYFLPGGDSGLVEMSFPYSLFLIRTVFGHFRIRAVIMRRPWFMEFYEEDHPSEGLAITAAILIDFRNTAIKRGQIPMISVIPTGPDLIYYRRTDIWPYENLLDRLADNGIDALNFGPGIMERLGETTDPCTLFDVCSHHYNELGYEYLAEIAYEELKKRGLLSVVTAE
jgi:hypothetical protein